mmetsp:Transcript_6070/g.15365  ORF Transcript_6070/g.15365 Transcript_6070/m.15365 type:complete len:429 (-) Transcript_6070:362-1648(-)
MAQLVLRALPARAARASDAVALSFRSSGSPTVRRGASVLSTMRKLPVVSTSRSATCWARPTALGSRRSHAIHAAPPDHSGGEGVERDGVVVVVGCGILGLSTAQELLRRGHRVTVVARSFDPQTTTSSVAAGFVFPYLLQPVSQCERWVRETLELCRAPPREDLCHPMESYVMHIEHEVAEPDWGSCGLDYRRLSKRELTEFNEARGGWVTAVDGFLVQTFCFNTGAYLTWLQEDITARGGRLVPRCLDSLMDVPAEEAALGGRVRAVVNCTGVHARTFVQDESVRPVYGQVVGLAPQAGVSRAYIIEDGLEELGGSAYVFPRRDKIICGGTAIADKWSEQPDPAITQGILERAAKLVPGLDVSEELILEERCGLRPSRPQLRLELEAAHACGRPVVHSYGHGGSGWTVFVGAAREAADLVEGALRPE